MKDTVKEIMDRLIEAEHNDGHLYRRDCWALLYEIFSLRKGVEAIFGYVSTGDILEIKRVSIDLMQRWVDETKT